MNLWRKLWKRLHVHCWTATLYNGYSVEVEQRWTFSSMGMSIAAACGGHGFAWYPEAHIRGELAAGRLKPLPLGGAEERFVELYCVVADPDGAGPGVRRLEEILVEGVVP